MNVLITAGLLLALTLWALGSYRRLVRLRQQVTLRWREVHVLRRRRDERAESDSASAAATEAGRALAQAERLYTLVADQYNAAIDGFPGNLLAGLAGFKRAESIEPS